MRKMPFEWRIVKDGYPKPLFQRHSRSTTETVHTFWNDAGVGDPTVLTVWAEHWARHGWMPRVLGVGAAAAHPSFDRLCGEYEKLPTINPKSYTMNNLLRWLAIEAVGGSWMADYDTITFAPPPLSLPNDGSLTVHSGPTPAVVSGSPREFGRVAELFASFYSSATASQKHRCFMQAGRPHVSDQPLLDCVRRLDLVKSTNWVDRLGEEPYLARKPSSCPFNVNVSQPPVRAGHFSHHSYSQLLAKLRGDESVRCICGAPWVRIFGANKSHPANSHFRATLVKTCADFWDAACTVPHVGC